MYCMIETAFDNIEEAKEVINELINKKLVASCQMVESISKWNWQQKMESAKEYLVFMKTKKNLQESYECFEFAVFDLNSCNQNYLNWINEETIK